MNKDLIDKTSLALIMVMITRWLSAQLKKEESEKNSIEIKAKVLLRVLVFVIKTS